MSIEKVREYFREFNMEDRVLEFPVSSATVLLAAEAINCKPQRIVKTLSFTVSGTPVLVSTAGDTKVDNAKFKSFFGVKAKMLTADEAEALIGHAVGGVCPFVVKEDVKVYVDTSVKRFDTVYPAAGSSSSSVKLTPDELYKYSNALEWVDVCKIVEE